MYSYLIKFFEVQLSFSILNRETEVRIFLIFSKLKVLSVQILNLSAFLK